MSVYIKGRTKHEQATLCQYSRPASSGPPGPACEAPRPSVHTRNTASWACTFPPGSRGLRAHDRHSATRGPGRICTSCRAPPWHSRNTVDPSWLGWLGSDEGKVLGGGGGSERSVLPALTRHGRARRGPLWQSPDEAPHSHSLSLSLRSSPRRDGTMYFD